MPSADTPQLSIIVPCLNGGDVIGEQLTALSQERTSFNWEVIVVDNGSTDDTAEVVQSFSADLDVRVIQEPERGRHHACNRGVAEARAPLVAFVDADDVIVAGYVQEMHGALAHSTVVAGRLVHDDGARFGRVQENALMPALGFLPYASGGNVGMHVESFERVGGFSDEIPFGEDVDLSWRLSLAGATIQFESAAAVRVHQRESLRSMFVQHRRFGAAHALLYRKYAAVGMPRRTWREVYSDYRSAVAALPHLRDPGVRGRWVRRVARLVGRVQGSIAARRLYL